MINTLHKYPSGHATIDKITSTSFGIIGIPLRKLRKPVSSVEPDFVQIANSSQSSLKRRKLIDSAHDQRACQSNVHIEKKHVPYTTHKKTPTRSLWVQVRAHYHSIVSLGSKENTTRTHTRKLLSVVFVFARVLYTHGEEPPSYNVSHLVERQSRQRDSQKQRHPVDELDFHTAVAFASHRIAQTHRQKSISKPCVVVVISHVVSRVCGYRSE